MARKLPVPIIVVASTLVFGCIAIIFGAPLLSDIENTLLFGLLLSALAVYPTALTSGGSVTKIVDSFVDFVGESPRQQQQLSAAAGALVGAWLGAFVIPLDWDRPWQVWPVPCCAGAQLGSAVGRLAASRICPAAADCKLE
ncbi:glycosylphosphatidylinositol anchor biosynthesis protein 11-like isoform X2 [Pollicipes pollicipes]|uniref:glycosylphosphatidylinositol anchor biosynthesis protein 11-like isoform X2 n=1 Tax=Pollicipes pollicipes TaxID=41117 RepID=UPI0018850F7D|nr:glycosylphosphatidylinositol anchor biosynthesis protein 11-like isoform X2 [Pollicipes pollicipes]